MVEQLAGNALVLSARGPRLVDALEPGVDRIWTVSRNGALALVEVVGVSPAVTAQAWHVLTSLGDLVLREGAYASTEGGRFLSGKEIDALVQEGDEVQLDVISPRDVEFDLEKSHRDGAVVRGALAAIRNQVVLPVANGVAETVTARLERLLREASVEYQSEVDDRWAAFVLEGLAGPELACTDFGKQAEALRLATAWEEDGGELVSRVRLADDHLLQCLIGALIGGGYAFEVRWTPKYRPVECRIHILEQPQWGAFAAVDAVRSSEVVAVDVELRGVGRPVVGLAVTTSSP